MKTYTRNDNYLDIRALAYTPSGQLEIGSVLVVVEADGTLTNGMGDEIVPRVPAYPVIGWGDTWDATPDNLIEIGGSITKKAWFDRAVASVK